MRIKITKKGECWNNSAFGDVYCPVCNSKSVEIEMDIDQEANKQTTFVKCSCGAEFEIES